MAINTEPIFIGSPFLKLVRVQTGIIVPPAIGAQVPTTLVNCPDTGNGGLVVDLWLQALGTISAGSFLRLFVVDATSPANTQLLSDVAIAAVASSPLPRQDLTASLPKVLHPTMTNVVGKKEALYLAPGQSLAIGLSVDLAVPIVIGCQGGYY